MIKEEANSGNALLVAIDQQSRIIVLDDSDEEILPHNVQVRNPSTTSVTDPRRTIKAEQAEEANYNTATSSRELDQIEEKPAKKIKLEQTTNGTLTSNNKAELLRLQEEDEREEEELIAAQKVALLIQKRNARKARIAELQAGGNATSTP